MNEINNSQDNEGKSNSIPQTDINTNVHIDSKSNLIESFITFFKSHTVYEAIPPNTKILVFNSRLSIKKAINAIIREDIYCSLIYDSNNQKVTDIMTLMDLISLLSFLHSKYKSQKDQIQSILFFIKEIFNKNTNINSLDIITEDKNEKTSSENQSLKSEVFEVNNEQIGYEMEDEGLNKTGLFDQENKCFNQLVSALALITIGDYIRQVKGGSSKELFTVTLDNSLYDCIIALKNKQRDKGIHRLIIEDIKSKKYCGFITYEAVFIYFIERYYSEININEYNFLASEVKGLISNISFSCIKTDSIYNCFELCLREKITFVPIYEQEDSKDLFGFVFIKDIIYLLADSMQFNFNDTIEKFLELLYNDIDEEKPYGRERIVILQHIDISIKELFESMSICPERKIVVKIKDSIGVITLESIFNSIFTQNNSL